MRADSAVEPTKSENMTVTWRRSARSWVETFGAAVAAAVSAAGALPASLRRARRGKHASWRGRLLYLMPTSRALERKDFVAWNIGIRGAAYQVGMLLTLHACDGFNELSAIREERSHRTLRAGGSAFVSQPPTPEASAPQSK